MLIVGAAIRLINMQVVRPLHQSLHKKKDEAWQRDVKMQETPYKVILGGHLLLLWRRAHQVGCQ